MKRPSAGTGELIVEIGTEEIPSRMIPRAMSDIEKSAFRFLSDHRIPAERMESMATPRRLVLHAIGIPRRQEARETELVGPPRSAAFDSAGKPTAAATGFARAQGVSTEQLRIKKTEKGDYLSVVRQELCAPTSRVLKTLLPLLISSLEFPKMMRWNGEGMRFARPIRWIVAVYDGTAVSFKISGVTASNRSRGHRFLGARDILVKDWKGYLRDLRRQHVVLDAAERENIIRDGLRVLSRSRKGRVEEDKDLLTQAIFLTEEPVVILGNFDPKYLELPSDVPVTAMKEHQGYFPLVGGRGELLPHFLFVGNIRGKDQGVIRSGNERVLRARLEDARFYFIQDQKSKLKDRVDLLKQLVYHEKLGTMHDKTERLRKLSLSFLEGAGRNGAMAGFLDRASLLCKTDLLTGMVREFPSLQGIVGREYALRQDETTEVSQAISEHYFPRHAEDRNPPHTTIGKYLTVADRLDALVGFFGADLTPSGSMDPYGLRRQGLGLIQVLLDEAFRDFSLSRAVEVAAGLYLAQGIRLKKDTRKIGEMLQPFMVQRMETYLMRRFPGEGEYRADLADAVLSRSMDNPLDLFRRFVALAAFQREPDFTPLIMVFKRASRILPPDFKGTWAPDAGSTPPERELHARFLEVEKEAGEFMRQHRYQEALAALARLRQPIDAFFKGVMVMDENPRVRENRLALLHGITGLFTQFGDFTKVVVEER